MKFTTTCIALAVGSLASLASLATLSYTRQAHASASAQTGKLQRRILRRVDHVIRPRCQAGAPSRITREIS
jgi:hypothetical protein